jgi:uncharacterized membrane protein
MAMKKIAFVLLGIGAAAFGDHIASYYLMQWSPALTRVPSVEERSAVMQALALDRVLHGLMWTALVASFLAWRAGVLRREPRYETAHWLRIALGGAAFYAVARVLVEAPLLVGSVRVPTTALDWHGPGFALIAVLLFLTAWLAKPPPRRVAPAAPRRR